MQIYHSKKSFISTLKVLPLLLVIVVSSFSQLKLLPKDAARGPYWVLDNAWASGLCIIHDGAALAKIKAGQNVSSSMSWTFQGNSGTYAVSATVLSHFSCPDKAWVKVNGQTVISGTIPKPNTGYCCDVRGQGCRNSAKDNNSTMGGSKVTVNKGDKIEYGGTTCVCFDKNNGEHGSYVGLFSINFDGGGTPPPPPPETPIIKVDKSSVAIPYVNTNTKYPEVMVNISNSGKGTLPKLTAATGDNWMTLSMGGSGNTQTLKIAINAQAFGAPAKVYNSSVTLQGADVKALVIPVALTVTKPTTGIINYRNRRPLSESQPVYRTYDVRGVEINSGAFTGVCGDGHEN